MRDLTMVVSFQSQMKTMMKTVMAVAAFALAIGNVQARNFFDDYNVRVEGTKMYFTSGGDGRDYWMDVSLCAQAALDGLDLARLANSHNDTRSLDDQLEYISRGSEMCSAKLGDALPAVKHHFEIIIMQQGINELRRLRKLEGFTD
jgi:hypothetical protein